jgi:hypothetical protein
MTRSPSVLHPLATPALLGETVDALRARDVELSERHPAAWVRWRRWESEQHGRGPTAFAGVLASFVALAGLAEPADLSRLVALERALGAERVAQLQHRARLVVDPEPDLPLTTTVVHRLLADESTGELGRALLFQDLDVQPARDEPSAAREARTALVAFGMGGSVAEGRRGLGLLAAAPWGPAAEELVGGAAETDRAVLSTLLTWCRDWRVEQDRALVGRQVQRLVALSGVTQRQFAARIGTSASRLSSYVGGSVTPSATMLLRIQRSARALQHERTTAAGSSANVAAPLRA